MGEVNGEVVEEIQKKIIKAMLEIEEAHSDDDYITGQLVLCYQHLTASMKIIETIEKYCNK